VSASWTTDADGNLTTGQTVVIQLPSAPSTPSLNNDGVGAALPSIPNDPIFVVPQTPNTTPVYTVVGGATIEQQTFTNSGIVAEPNGNLTLRNATGEEVVVSYVRAVRTDIFNPG
ncbi:hypothetical protein RZS08_57375, partial [Arthrospira platensis SPKY1]|nr:hypothetical protein [Arthrospira platensis SPKY1]